MWKWTSEILENLKYGGGQHWINETNKISLRMVKLLWTSVLYQQTSTTDIFCLCDAQQKAHDTAIVSWSDGEDLWVKTIRPVERSVNDQSVIACLPACLPLAPRCRVFLLFLIGGSKHLNLQLLRSLAFSMRRVILCVSMCANWH